MEGEEEGFLAVRAVGNLMFFCVLMTVGPEGAFSAFFLAGGEEEVGGEFAGDHDAGSSCVKPSFAAILLYHSI